MAAGAYSAQRIRQNLMFFMTGKSLSAIVGFLILMLLVRALSPADYGFFIVLLGLFEVLQLGSNIGCFPAVYRYVPALNLAGHPAHLKKFMARLSAIRLATLLFVAGLMHLLAAPVFGWLGFGQAGKMALFFPLYVLFEGLNRYNDQLFDALMLQGRSQTSALFRNSLRLAGLLTLTWLIEDAGETSLERWFAVECIASGAGFVFTALLLRAALSARTAKDGADEAVASGALPELRRVMDYVMPAYGAQMLWLAQWPDMVKMLIARLADSVQAGAFGFCATLNSMLQRYLPVFLLIGMVRPIFVSAKEKGRTNQELVQLASLVFKLNLFLLCPALVVALFQGDALIALLSGNKFVDAGGYFSAFIVLLMLQSLHMVMSLLAMVMENGKAMLKAMFWGLTGIGAGVAGVPLLGPLSLALGLILSEAIRCCVVQAKLKENQISFTLEWAGLGKMFLASLLSGGILLVVEKITFLGQLWGLLAGLVAMGGSYALLSFLLKPFLLREREKINRVLPRPVFLF